MIANRIRTALSAVTLLLGSTLPTTIPADTELRTKLVLYPYHGLSGVDTESLAADLAVYLSDKAQNIYATFATDPEAAYMANLHVENRQNKPGTVSARAEQWQKLHALMLMDGVIETRDGTTMAKSSIYLGKPDSAVSDSAIEILHLSLPLESAEYGTITDTHSAAAMYVIALDLKRAGLPAAFYIRVAARALDIVETLTSTSPGSQDLLRLQCGLVNLISTAAGIASAEEC